jgi:hypothetical protein
VQEEDWRACQEAGIDARVGKPIDARELAGTLRTWVRPHASSGRPKMPLM